MCLSHTEFAKLLKKGKHVSRKGLSQLKTASKTRKKKSKEVEEDTDLETNSESENSETDNE